MGYRIRVPAADTQAVWMPEFEHGKMQTDQSGEDLRTGGSGSDQLNIDRLGMEFWRSDVLHDRMLLKFILDGTRYRFGKDVHLPCSRSLTIFSQKRSRPRG
ncbi:hypothetical protein SDC9_177022 [bioreactor metagenome]|uniref:Uncharacterized protein n=1 Tax=bioreactor metagenome TaxID=1076179 RepID=A0A645GUY9_9ZZZZ